MGKNTPIDFNSYTREVYSQHLIQRFNGRIGGVNKIVLTKACLYIEKTTMCHNTLNYEDIYRENGKCFFLQISNRDGSTLMEKNCEHVEKNHQCTLTAGNELFL